MSIHGKLSGVLSSLSESLSVSVACCDEWARSSVLAVSEASGVCGDSLSDSVLQDRNRYVANI